MSRDINKLHPKLQTIIPELKERCADAGLNVLITDCI